MRATQELKELAARIADLPDPELLRRIASGAFAESAHRIALAEAQGRGLDLMPVADEESEPEASDEAWQVVRRFASGTEAQIVARRLEVEDIPVHVATGGVLLTDSATSDPGAGAARLSVPVSAVARAASSMFRWPAWMGQNPPVVTSAIGRGPSARRGGNGVHSQSMSSSGASEASVSRKNPASQATCSPCSAASGPRNGSRAIFQCITRARPRWPRRPRLHGR